MLPAAFFVTIEKMHLLSYQKGLANILIPATIPSSFLCLPFIAAAVHITTLEVCDDQGYSV